MKKRWTALVLAVCMAVCLLPVGALAADASGTCGDNLTWTLSDDGTLTISGTGDMTDWEGYDEVPWYDSSDSITTVVLESGVTSIGKSAFKYCNSLTSVTIPDSVTSIGEGAFRACDSLTSVNIPSSVTSIGELAFGSCESLNDVYYSGSEEEWNQIDFGDDVWLNTPDDREIHYNAQTGDDRSQSEDGQSEDTSDFLSRLIDGLISFVRFIRGLQ